MAHGIRDDQLLSMKHNGIYLGIIELISYYDPFLKDHIGKYNNKGIWHTNYISSTICNSIIQLIADNVFRFSIDSTSGIRHFK